MILELNKPHIRIPLWNRSTTMMMYWTNRGQRPTALYPNPRNNGALNNEARLYMENSNDDTILIQTCLIKKHFEGANNLFKVTCH